MGHKDLCLASVALGSQHRLPLTVGIKRVPLVLGSPAYPGEPGLAALPDAGGVDRGGVG